MSNKNYLNYYQKNKLQLSSRPFHPKGKKTKTFQNSNQNDSNETNESLKDIIQNKNIQTFIPKKMRKNEDSEKININLSLEAEEYFPNKEKLLNQEKEKNEKEEREKIQKEKEEKIKKEYIYSYEYLMQFETYEISNQTELLPEETLKHINQIEEKLKEMKSFYPKQNSKCNYSNCNTSKSSSSSNISFSMEQWARKDYSKEIKVAEENKIKLKESDEKDTTKKELRELLNILTKDNYDDKKSKILEIIKENVKIQEQFLDIFFLKAIKEKAYGELYAKLCKYLNKELPQKSKKKEKAKNTSSIFRDILINKCREILKSKNYDIYIKEEDPTERKIKIKKFILGNVNFLTELIKIKLLSKKIMPDCIEYLFDKYKNETDSYLKLIHAEAIVILTDRFGSLVHSESNNKNIKTEEIQNLKEKIEEIFIKLDKLKDDNGLPGHIKYLIINLIEKKKNNYEESQFEKSLKAKSKKELEEELLNKEKQKEENEGKNEKEKEKNEQEEINEKIKNDLNEYKEFIEETGNSEEYPWNITTELYDEKLKSFDDILEGYIIGSEEFIEKNNNNIKYAKDYIKELITYYNEKMKEEEKIDIQKRIFNLFELVNDLAFETPKIYELYAYVLYIFIEYNIMKIEDLENIFKNEVNKGYKSTISKIFLSIYELNKNDLFKKELKKFEFINENKEIFKWVFNDNEA